jgi:tRNA(Ile)-lysidine synthase
LIKGTGLEGLRGIPVINGNIVRPLLFASREQLENYALDNKLHWREDSSNRTSHYARNKIRNELIPIIEEINPGYAESLIRSAERLKDSVDLLDKYTGELIQGMVRKEGTYLYIHKRKVLETNSRNFLYTIIKDYGFNYDQTLEIWNRIEDQSGKSFWSGQYLLVIDRDEIIISDSEQAKDAEYDIEEDKKSLNTHSGRFIFAKRPFSKINRNLTANIAWLDFDKLNFPLKLRKWRIGDKFQPMGMQGKKKLSDLMIDMKIPLNLKNQILVLESNGEIVWVVGLRIDERFKLTPKSRYIYQIEFNYPDEKSLQENI